MCADFIMSYVVFIRCQNEISWSVVSLYSLHSEL